MNPWPPSPLTLRQAQGEREGGNRKEGLAPLLADTLLRLFTGITRYIISLLFNERENEMAEEPLNIIDEEKQVQKYTIGKHSEEFELMASMLNLYLDGFSLVGKYKLDNNEADWVLLLLLTRSFHSLRSCIELIKKGYYVQAIALTRIVTENYFICGNCRKDQDIVEAIIHNKPNRPNGKTKFNYKSLAQNMGSSFTYEKDYTFECQFAHCSNLSANVMTKEIDDKNRELSLAPSYNELMFMASCELFFRNGLLMTIFLESFLSALSEEKVNVWRNKSALGFEKITKWLAGLKKNIQFPSSSESASAKGRD